MKFRALLFCCLGSLIFLASTSAPAAVQTDGPLVGGVTDTSAKIFTRTDTTAFVTVEFSEDPFFASAIQTFPALTTILGDFTAILTLNGLRPEATYYYRILVDGIPQQVAPFPSFITFPPPDTSKGFRFVILSDLVNTRKIPTLPASVYAQVATEEPAFVLQIGDFDHRDPETLREMRRMHRENRGLYTASGIDFFFNIALRFPLFHVYDDHDYGINNGDKTFSGRANALRAFQEYYPTPDLANPTAGIWHKFTHGQAEFFMLDLRSQRDPNTASDGPNKSMLDGNRIPNGQKDWLKAGLLASTARWKFIVSTVCFNPTCKPKDSWGAFPTERAEILSFIRQNDIHGVIVLSGDLHSGGGIDDGTNSGLPEMNVPHTNLLSGDSGPKGKWSEGIISGNDGASGYALVTVGTNPDQVILEVKGVQGELRKRLLVSAFIDVTQSAGLHEEGFAFGNPIWGDFDNDGNLDLFADNHYQEVPFLYRNNGNGTFTDIQSTSGISYKIDRHGSGWGDFDNDGDLDLFISRGADKGNLLGHKRDEFYSNLGEGQFTNISVIAGAHNAFGRGRSVVWGDYNRDGYLDLLLGNFKTNMTLYKNNGDGTFLDQTVEAGLGDLISSACTFADCNNDGLPDIFCAGGGSDLLLKNNGDATFTNASEISSILPLSHGQAIAWGDYDNDGDLDLFISRGFNDQNDSISWNESTVTFSDMITVPASTGINFQDNTNSMLFDLYLDGSRQPDKVFIGAEKIHPGEIPFSLASGSNIGKPDYIEGVDEGFFIWEDSPGDWKIRWSGNGEDDHHFYGVLTGCCITSLISLFEPLSPSIKDTFYQNNGDGTFTEITDQAGLGSTTNNRAAVWGDFDNDGYLDLYVVNSGSSTTGNGPGYLYRNNQDGTFTNVTDVKGIKTPTTGRGHGAAWGDYDNDGFLDLFLTYGEDIFPNRLGPHVLYHNEGNSNNWLKIKLVGTFSNRQGIGARVAIKIGQNTLYREANEGNGGHFLSQGAGPLHFGLGHATLIDKILIQWPSGLRQVLNKIAINQEITIVEGP
jgi:alkaline phosphatase D